MGLLDREKKFSWNIFFWIVALLWALFCAWSTLLSNAIYIVGPIVLLAMWFVPVLPLLIFTWVTRLRFGGIIWTLIPIAIVIIALVLVVAPFELPIVYIKNSGVETTEVPIVFIATLYCTAVYPILSAVLLLWGALQNKPNKIIKQAKSIR